jgi:thiol:disulfide interchange protein
MHTIKVLAAGFLLLGLCLFLGHRFGGAPGLAGAAKYFIPLWLVGAAVNMWIGVTQAGYSVRDEASIFCLIFAVPSAAALGVWWRYSPH